MNETKFVVKKKFIHKTSVVVAALVVTTRVLKFFVNEKKVRFCVCLFLSLAHNLLGFTIHHLVRSPDERSLSLFRVLVISFGRKGNYCLLLLCRAF